MKDDYKYINSIFESSEWLQHSFGENVTEVLLRKGDIIQGRWAFGSTVNKYGFKIISMPNGNQSCGPWLQNFGGKQCTVLGNKNKLLEGLIKKLPYYDYLKLSLDTSIISAYPFYWNNISYTTRYTYVLDTTKTLDEIELGFDNNIRKDLKKSKGNLIVDVSAHLDVKTFVSMHKMVFDRTNSKYPYSEDYIRSFSNFFLEKKMLKVITIKDFEGNIHTQIILIDDLFRVQYVFGASDTRFRGSGSSTLALFHGIKIAKEKNKEFNFYGSMTRSIENYFRSFGANLTPYYSIEHMSRRYKRFNKFKNFLK